MDQILRHVNGGATKIGTEVHVSADSFADINSALGGSTNVFNSSVIHSHLNCCNVFDSVLVWANGKMSVYSKSSLQNVILNSSVVDRVKILGSDPFKPLRLWDVVAENCELYGNWTLEGNARIPTGIWHRAPRYKRITGDNGVSVGLTESTEGYALMACWRKPITKWLKYGPRLGTKHRWTAQQIEDARLFFQELLDVRIEGVIPSA